MNLRAGLLGLLVLSLGYVAEAKAQPREYPPECTSRRDMRAYDAGVDSGISLVRHVWSVVRDCNQMPRIESILADTLGRLTPPHNASSYVVCRYAGTREGIAEELDATRSACPAP